MSKSAEYAALFEGAPKPKKPSRKSQLEESFAEELKLYGLPPAVRQCMFHPSRKWPFDFGWPEQKIAVEIHGGIYVPQGKGAHNRGASMEGDFEKQNEATRLGWRVFIFGPKWLYRKKRTNASSKALTFMHGLFRAIHSDSPAQQDKEAQSGGFDGHE